MTKTNKTFSIDHDIWQAAKATGHNLSEICEHALQSITNIPEELFADVMDLEQHNKLLNEMIYDVFNEPEKCSVWAKLIRDLGIFNSSPVLIRGFVDELTEGDKEYYEKIEAEKKRVEEEENAIWEHNQDLLKKLKEDNAYWWKVKKEQYKALKCEKDETHDDFIKRKDSFMNKLLKEQEKRGVNHENTGKG